MQTVFSSANQLKELFSPATELYGERIEKKSATSSEDPAILRTSETTIESNAAVLGAPQALRVGSDIALTKRGDQTFAVLKTLKVALELGVQHSFPTFYNWIHNALPLLSTAISKYLNTAASVRITTCELFLSSHVRKYAALEVLVIALPGSFSAESIHNLEQMLTFHNTSFPELRRSSLLEAFIAELSTHGIVIPDELVLSPASSEVSIEDMEFPVDIQQDESALASSEEASRCAGDACSKQGYTLYAIAASVAVLVSAFVIFFLFRKYRRLSQEVCELKKVRQQRKERKAQKQEHEQVMSDLEKQASEIKHATQAFQHERDSIQLDTQQLAAKGLEQSGLETEKGAQTGNIEQLPTLLATRTLTNLISVDKEVKN